MSDPPRNRWQFRLGDLLWVVLICAILSSWWVDRRRLEDKARAEQQWQQATIERLRDAQVRQSTITVQGMKVNVTRKRMTPLSPEAGPTEP